VRITRFFSLVDVIVAVAVACTVFLQCVPRPTYALEANKLDDEGRWALAVADARALARPADGAAAAELSRRLREARWLDWAVAAPAQAAETSAPPSKWRALFATAVSYASRLEVKAADEWAQRALSACTQAAAGCPTWEEARMQLYEQHLAAGIRSGIDPRKDPEGFRRAGEQALRQIRLIDRTPSRSHTP